MATKEAMDRFEADFWFLIKPAEDLEGQWIGHCLNLDVVTQGNSPRHALEMLVEAVQIVVFDDLDSGKNPLARSQAPSENWQEWSKVLRNGHKVLFSEVHKADLPVVVEAHFAATKLHLEKPDNPPAWVIDDLAQSKAPSAEK